MFGEGAFNGGAPVVAGTCHGWEQKFVADQFALTRCVIVGLIWGAAKASHWWVSLGSLYFCIFELETRV